jgi:glyoxylase-like metal-dependent hydrolase (beta-lactamase superfamily II)
MVKVKQLIVGNHKMLENGLLGISSTVTLIKTDKNILVDTGSFKEKDNLIEALQKEGLTPKDIDIVILTHTHIDHCMNLHLFFNAKVYCKFLGKYPGQMHSIKQGVLQRTEIKDNVEVAENVSLLLTPGHTNDSISVIVSDKKNKIVICGDAFYSEKNVDNDPLDIVTANISDYKKSRDKILKIADYIIPGHGKMFKVK